MFLSILLSKTSRWFCSVTVMAHVAQPYVTVGRIIDLYICSLLAALRSLFGSSVLPYLIDDSRSNKNPVWHSLSHSPPPTYSSSLIILPLTPIIRYILSSNPPVFLCIMFFICPHFPSFCSKLYILSFHLKQYLPLSFIQLCTRASISPSLFITYYPSLACIIHYILSPVQLFFVS